MHSGRPDALGPGGQGNSATQQRGAAAAGTPSPSLTRLCARLRGEPGTGGPTPGPRDARPRGPAGPARPAEGPLARPAQSPRPLPARTSASRALPAAGSPPRAGRPREGCAGWAGGKRGGDMARYLDSGDGEGGRLSRRG